MTVSPRLARDAVLAIATHNRGKLAEFADLLRPFDLDPIAASALGMTTVPVEDALDFAGNAAIKARAVADATGRPALADDSGFCVASLAGAPGVHSARWAGEPPDFGAAMRRVHDAAARHPDRSAAFVCVLCLAWPGIAQVATATGRIEGDWIWPPRGDAGFGYDPIFVPAGERRSFGEMRRDEKSRLSHRARALVLLSRDCFPAPIEPGSGPTRTPGATTT